MCTLQNMYALWCICVSTTLCGTPSVPCTRPLSILTVMYLLKHICMRNVGYVCVHAKCSQICAHVHICVCVCMCVCVYMCVCVCIFVCACCLPRGHKKVTQVLLLSWQDKSMLFWLKFLKHKVHIAFKYCNGINS